MSSSSTSHSGLKQHLVKNRQIYNVSYYFPSSCIMYYLHTLQLYIPMSRFCEFRVQVKYGFLYLPLFINHFREIYSKIQKSEVYASLKIAIDILALD